MAQNQSNQKSTVRAKSMDGICHLLRSDSGAQALAAYKQASNDHNKKSAPTSTGRKAPVMPFLDNLPRLVNIGKDGVDHINVGTSATTDLGKIFSLADGMSYTDKLLGLEVYSIRSFHNFARSGAKRVSLLRTEARPLHQEAVSHPAHYFALMAHAMYSKVMSHEPLATVLRDLQAPIDCYITNQGERRRTLESNVYALTLREIRKSLLNEGMEFQLWKFLDAEEATRIKALPAAERYEAAVAVIEGILRQSINSIKNMITLQGQAQEAKKQQPAKKAKGPKKEGRKQVNVELQEGKPEDAQAQFEEVKAAATEQLRGQNEGLNFAYKIATQDEPVGNTLPEIKTSEQLDEAFRAGTVDVFQVGTKAAKPVIAVESFTPPKEDKDFAPSLELVASVAEASTQAVEEDDKKLLDSVLQVAEVAGDDAAVRVEQ